jgi:acyl-CoA synthetase (NDP forming)
MERLLLGMDALDFLEKEGLRVLDSSLAREESEAAGMASGIGFPVALKVSSPDVIHKTETGGIRVPLKSEDEVRQAFRDIVTLFRSDNPEKQLDGVMVQKLGRGLELIVGATKDQQFGPVLTFGLGGIYAEAIKDVSFRLIPVRRGDVREMMEELQSYRILKNPRSGTIELRCIEDFLLQVSNLVEKHAEIEEMDLNPVFVASKDIVICDARIRLGQGERRRCQV